MKIAQFIRRFSFEEWGGTENVVWNSSRYLKKGNVDVEILSTQALSNKKREEKENILIRRFKYFYPYFPLRKSVINSLDKKGGAPYSWQLLRAFNRGNYSLIHVHSGGRCAQLALKSARNNKIPCVFSLHGGYSDVPQNELKEMLSPTRHSFHYGGIIDRILGLRKDLISNMDAVICVGENEYEILKEKYPNKKIVFMPNGIEVDKFDNVKTSDIENFKNTYNIPENNKIVLCVSRIDYQKNQKLLVEFLSEAIKNDQKIHLLLVGPETVSRYGEELRTLAKEKNVFDKMTIIPGLAPDSIELKSAYKCADVFILPSLHEPFGIVILEAWSANLPVLSTNAGGAGKLVRDNEDGLTFDARDVKSLLNVYEKLDKDSKLAEKISTNGKRRSFDYSWEEVTSKLLDLYKEVIEESSDR